MTFIFGKYFNVAINFIKNWLFFILIQFLLKILKSLQLQNLTRI